MNPTDPTPQKSGSTPLSAEDLITLNEEIAGMAQAGLPLDQGLSALAREMGSGRLQAVTTAIAHDLQAGYTLAQALDRQGERVPPYYANLMTVGVRTGRITEVLATLTVYARALSDVRTTIVSALFYPAVVIVFSLLLFAGVFFFLVPRWEEIFTGFRMKLPLLTQVMIFISHHPLEVMIVPVAVIALGLGVIKLIFRQSAEGRRLWTRMIYTLPIVGTLIRSARLAAFTDLLGILVKQQVPLTEAFRLAGQASSDPLTASGAREVETQLSQGASLGDALRHSRLMPEFVSWMTGLSEKRGTLGEALHQVAQIYRRQVDMRANLLKSVLPPFLVIVTAGVLAGLFIAGIMHPLLALMEGLTGGMSLTSGLSGG